MSEVAAKTLLDRVLAMGIAVDRLENDSRRVQPGDIFVAYPGARADGRTYIPDALRRGAAAVLWERAGFHWNPSWLRPHLGVDGLQSICGYLADQVHRQPSAHLRLIGVTGTNGKTTSTQWLAQALSAAGRPCAVIGTLGNGFPGGLEGSLNTTPDSLALHSLLARYRDAGATACAIEVSSIGLDQERCNGARFEIAVFTNLTRDHLDYHGTMEAYGAAKERLFVWPGLKVAVLNLDDPFSRALLKTTVASRRIGYTIDDHSGTGCDLILRAGSITHADTGVHFPLHLGREALEISAPVVGRYNVANLLAVAGALLGAGFEFAALPALLRHLSPPAGRLQRFGGAGAPLVLVDYAHSPDALAAVLDALRPVADSRNGRLVCLFGCGGDRDHGKRPLMGEVAARKADLVWLTSDNPRGEPPAAIIAEIAQGAPRARIEVDREQAIRTVIGEAQAGDVILVAGKGHETYQEIAGVRHPFADAAVVRKALAGRTAKEKTA